MADDKNKVKVVEGTAMREHIVIVKEDRRGVMWCQNLKEEFNVRLTLHSYIYIYERK